MEILFCELNDRQTVQFSEISTFVALNIFEECKIIYHHLSAFHETDMAQVLENFHHSPEDRGFMESAAQIT